MRKPGHFGPFPWGGNGTSQGNGGLDLEWYIPVDTSASVAAATHRRLYRVDLAAAAGDVTITLANGISPNTTAHYVGVCIKGAPSSRKVLVRSQSGTHVAQLQFQGDAVWVGWNGSGWDILATAGPDDDMVVANGAALATLDDTLLENGAKVCLLSVLDTVQLLKTSALTVDNTTVWATQSGTGRYVRACQPALTWLRQTDWGINPSTGSDENVGTVASPLKTSAELQRRIGVWGTLPNATIITILADFPTNESFRLRATMAEGTPLTVGSPASVIELQGTRTQVATGVLTGYTPLSRAGLGSRNVIAAAATNFTGLEDYYVRLTSGAGAGYGCWIQVGANGSAQTTPWCQENNTPLATPTFPPLLQPAGIVAGDTFVIERMVSLGGCPQFCINYGGGAQAASGRQGVSTINVRSVRLTAHSEILAASMSPEFVFLGGGLRVYIQSSDLQAGINGTDVRGLGMLVAGGLDTQTPIPFAIRFAAGGTRARTPITEALMLTSGYMAFDGDFCFNCKLYAGYAGGVAAVFNASVRFGNVYFNVTGDAATFGMDARGYSVQIDYAPGQMYGQATARGVRCMSGGFLFYTNKPTINTGLGANRETIIGGVDTLWAAVPSVNALNLAGIAVAAT